MKSEKIVSPLQNAWGLFQSSKNKAKARVLGATDNAPDCV